MKKGGHFHTNQKYINSVVLTTKGDFEGETLHYTDADAAWGEIDQFSTSGLFGFGAGIVTDRRAVDAGGGGG
ncbi:hypothetical protein [Methanoculleus sp. 10]|uniref:hypothetical protein n=1 Tax=Methanoculleus sp. 10 TaxID=430615 RepID=UPI0025F4EC96|nr:hypothetical protein [Methanoculleus sp. 10]